MSEHMSRLEMLTTGRDVRASDAREAKACTASAPTASRYKLLITAPYHTLQVFFFPSLELEVLRSGTHSPSDLHSMLDQCALHSLICVRWQLALLATTGYSGRPRRKMMYHCVPRWCEVAVSCSQYNTPTNEMPDDPAAPP